MTRQAVHEWALRHGYKPDRHGHLVKTLYTVGANSEKKTYRFHLSQNAARKEVRHAGRWIRLRSGYLKNLTLNEKDQIQGLTAAGCQVKDAHS